MQRKFQFIGGFAAIMAAGILLIPSPIDAEYWELSDADRASAQLNIEISADDITLLALRDAFGPEDVTVDANGTLYASSANGVILKKSPQQALFSPWCSTQGFPLGLRFDRNGSLIVADALRGLLRIAPDCEVTVLVDTYKGMPLGFVDAVAIAQNGTIYFTDASAKFGPRDFDNPTVASHLDILEHGGHGRVFAYQPADKSLELLTADVQFANGIVVSRDQQSLLVNETGSYRILTIPLEGPQRGSPQVLIDNLPGFPDNLSLADDAGYWVGLAAPRSTLLDHLATWPSVRNLIAKLPHFLQPQAVRQGHLLKISAQGDVIFSLIDRSGKLALTTGVLDYERNLYITSLTEPYVVVIDRALLSD